MFCIPLHLDPVHYPPSRDSADTLARASVVNWHRFRARVGLPMSRGASLTLGESLTNTIAIFNLRLRDPSRFFRANSGCDSMADEAKIHQPKPEIIGNEKELEEESKTKEELTLPPPPEKPLPGDCCGSGCVRCVWDIYYEELEAYDKLCKSNSESKSTPS
ncbi:hypothetical protein F2P56_021371 [Juglans regia]|uniref:Oxidoreductase-like domain-containing protein n=2 Tax=Juglans regia TaxID=51240 RepID=A0A833UHT9_JUGRE|nr:uncharacterized protein LOC108997129 [Juglans regia]KAF5457257.1 hypothetical protein F2P56_021371 [Juglans regia]